jgi:hypothetical protein
MALHPVDLLVYLNNGLLSAIPLGPPPVKEPVDHTGIVFRHQHRAESRVGEPEPPALPAPAQVLVDPRASHFVEKFFPVPALYDAGVHRGPLAQLRTQA